MCEKKRSRLDFVGGAHSLGDPNGLINTNITQNDIGNIWWKSEDWEKKKID